MVSETAEPVQLSGSKAERTGWAQRKATARSASPTKVGVSARAPQSAEIVLFASQGFSTGTVP